MRAFAVLALVACASQTPPPAAPAPIPTALAQLEAARDLAGTPVGHADAPTVAIVFASWCEHCKAELAELDAVRARHPNVRLLGVNYRGHEEYGARGGSAAVTAFAARYAWLRVVPIGDDVWAALGSPPAIPTLYVYDSRGALVRIFDRRAHTPDRTELDALLSPLQ
jgi:thiol-disulfide isomerase/thioredoxin